MLHRLVESYFIVLRWNPVKLAAEGICGRRLGLCRYADSPGAYRCSDNRCSDNRYSDTRYSDN